jgi:hypothetical protein
VADFVFNIAKGRVAEIAALALANDALIAVPVETSGIETDAVLKDKDDLAAVFSGATNEQTTMGRKTLTGVAVTTDDSGDRVLVDFDDITWAAATGNPISAVIIAADLDTTGGADSAIIPLTKHDFVGTPDGNDIVAVVDADGFYDAGE